MNEQTRELVRQINEAITNPLYAPQVWMLTVGEYDDYSVLGVVIGDEAQARRKAQDIALERVREGYPSDLILVDVEKAEVL